MCTPFLCNIFVDSSIILLSQFCNIVEDAVTNVILILSDCPDLFTSSDIVPAIPVPVGPPPTITI